MKKLMVLLCIVCFFSSYAQSNDEADIKAINKVLKKQRIAWSNNNLEEFMEGYWKNDSLKFYGSNGVTYGWENTLERYQKAYPTKEHTGKLNFRINAITKISEGAYYVLGEYHLKRDVGKCNAVIFKSRK